MSNVDPITALQYFLEPVNENLTASWTAVSSAIECTQSLLSKIERVTAADYERFGKQLADMAADYSRALSAVAEGAGTVIEREAYSEVAVSIANAVDNLREGGAEAYSKFGKGMLEAADAARIAKIAAVGGAVVDLAELSTALIEVRDSGNWKKLGEVSSGIVAATGLGETGAFIVGTIFGAAGIAGVPLGVTTFIAAGAFAYIGSRSGDFAFERISALVNTLFTQSRNWQYIDPLALDLDGDGIETSGVNASSHVLFDHDGDGVRQGTGWLKGDDGWLVLDRDGNGRIDRGCELFGSDTELPSGRKASNGFAALAALDGNHDRVFNAADAAFSRVQIWRDLDQDGLSEAGELQSLADAGIQSISLASVDRLLGFGNGNQQTASASFMRTDGSVGKVANLNLASNNFFREFSSPIKLTADASRLPNLHGSGSVRDLREAASLYPDLARQVNAFHGLSRIDMMGKVDKLIGDWASAADFKTSKERAAELGLTLICRLPGMTEAELLALELAGQRGRFNEQTPLAQKVSLERYASLLAQVTETSRELEILEAFNGQNYLDLPEDPRRLTQSGSGVSVNSPSESGSYSFILNGAGAFEVASDDLPRESAIRPAVFLVVPLSWVNQTLPLERAFNTLKESVYDALVLRTRLKDDLDAVSVKVNGQGMAFDFTALDARLEQHYRVDPIQAFIDCIDLYNVGNHLVRAGWQGAARLSGWAADIAARGQLKELQASLAAAFATSPAGALQLSIGSAAAERLNAEAKHALLVGLGGNDSLAGGGGDDILDGGAGEDVLVGRDGSDTYLFARGSGRDQILNWDEGAAKCDVVQFGAGIGSGDVQVLRRSNDLLLNLKGSEDRVTVERYFTDDAGGYYRLEEIRFADGTVWNIAAVKAMVQQGTAGDDELFGYAVADTLSGGDGRDTLTGAGGNDVLRGGAGNDWLSGDQGDDTLDGGAGDDLLTGDLGNDVYLFGRGDGKDTIHNFYTSPGKVDAIQLGADITVRDVRLTNEEGSLLLSLNGTSDQVRVSGYFTADAAPTYRVDEIRFADGTVWDVDVIKARVQQGTAANDCLYGYAVADTMRGGDGNDRVLGFAGNDALHGDAGEDTLAGGEGDDLLYGGEGDDMLYGASGNDTLDGGAGNDLLNGGAGSDVYLFGHGSGQDALHEVDDHARSTDAVQLRADVAAGDLQLIRRADELEMKLVGSSDRLTIFSFFYENGTGGGLEIRFSGGTVWNREAIKAKVQQGTAGNDDLYGYAVADTLSGDDGDDLLRGAAGDDTLYGDRGADCLLGEAGADRLDGGDGNDQLNGGDGDDVLLGQDGVDRLEGDRGNDLLRGGAGNDSLVDSDGANLFDAGVGNDQLAGGAGNDILTGGTGNDRCTAGAGNDLILFNLGDGRDTLSGSSGSDVISLGGGFSYADLRLSKSGSDLLLDIGVDDQITLSGWYAMLPARSVTVLQVIAESLTGYQSGGNDPALDQKVECFDFGALAAAYDAARSTNPKLVAWAVSDALAGCRLTGSGMSADMGADGGCGSDIAAYGGDIAYQYGLQGSIDLVGTAKVFDLLSDTALGSHASLLTDLRIAA